MVKNLPKEKSTETLRILHRGLRDAMMPEEVRRKSDRICEQLLASACYHNSDTVYGYYPLGNEVDCLPILRDALKRGKQIALPKTGKDFQMEFYRIFSLNEVASGHFHVMEPKEGCPLVQSEAAVVLVPGVVFDRQGNRYGYGKGYYDRYLARYSGLETIGLAYEHQMEEKLLTKATDISMRWVYTEGGCYSKEMGSQNEVEK
ncbi:MAG: 5-formyltetrahydrofolate cyclo-ligase [Clostridiales bacterium]|nr:5-formyltetrahydrofolate cyclo-ligase [Clostridiales bacterium]